MPISNCLSDRLLHHAIVVQIEGSSYRLREHADRYLTNCATGHRR
ncbi:ATP-binding protein [Paraburkholderia sp. Ac-20347]|nr:ATP-binding protein [Paraburkholderia sp. Ac-20347]